MTARAAARTLATITYLSGMIAPAVTGWLADTLGYPTAFALITGVVALLILLAPALRRRAKNVPTPEEREDPVESPLPA
ncbi:hypothetical protein [Nonomuraea sp. 10N515B]|uniref:hypothetical protein n=1 Tax=Nonomuraea sp. 10N515B TaxID=3457422 RepID=UPI003FCCAAB6